MHERARVLCAGAGALAVVAVVTGCGVQKTQATTVDLVPATSSPPPSAAAASSRGTADTATCFDVAEAYSGLELLPLTEQDEDEDKGDDDAVAQARASLASLRERLPEAVQPAFEDVREVLDDAGETLQSREAVRVHKALEPAESWLQANCASTPTG
ncbi:hypothetical protein KVA01_10200 [Kocuria varians]|uniref:Lipoprotein n=1 Tax=Kocuria varians TaxID=1272 RepID=A0A4Y4D116_KOCVA|nr:hypothetical protein [Kocuria varians]GEC98865.1 hypothetical protein KVA01_10200 [Kocuria varians]